MVNESKVTYPGIQTLIRDNLMTRRGYSPYCGNAKCNEIPRTIFNGEQFKCPWCGWTSMFDSEFIQTYKERWNK